MWFPNLWYGREGVPSVRLLTLRSLRVRSSLSFPTSEEHLPESITAPTGNFGAPSVLKV